MLLLIEPTLLILSPSPTYHQTLWQPHFPEGDFSSTLLQIFPVMSGHWLLSGCRVMKLIILFNIFSSSFLLELPSVFLTNISERDFSPRLIVTIFA